jgi:hypothetical protein
MESWYVKKSEEGRLGLGGGVLILTVKTNSYSYCFQLICFFCTIRKFNSNNNKENQKLKLEF